MNRRTALLSLTVFVAAFFLLLRSHRDPEIKPEIGKVPLVLEKDFKELTGERNDASENAAKNLTRAASWIEGRLGSLKTGWSIRRENGPADWPLLLATQSGKNPQSPAVWVLSSYDSRPGSPGVEANATGIVATLAAIEAISEIRPNVNLHFVFLPHANDPESPVLETAAILRRIITSSGNPKAILCVEAMGSGKSLWLSSRDTMAAPLTLADGIGTVQGAEVICLGEDVDLASVLFEMNLPAVRVATRPIVTPAEADDSRPAMEILAVSTGNLVELIRRCADIR